MKKYKCMHCGYICTVIVADDVEVVEFCPVDRPPLYAIDWWHIVDADKPGEIVAGTTGQAFGAEDLPGSGELYGYEK